MLSPTVERDLFHRLRMRFGWRLISDLLANARLRVTVIVILTAVFWGGMFWVFLEGFGLLDQAISHEATKTQTILSLIHI